MQRTKAEGKSLGRPQRLSSQQKQEALLDLESGMSVSATSRKHGVSRQTTMRLRRYPAVHA
ncbi:helix-turn-helix domain-containing protein [Pseudovibrio sp. Ad5]|uniref:helix-turn-helix domain-containing protein n=1 Tax=Pseudovibrio sp. Ad5 TaxID=989436 RepID=UPI00406D1E3A